MQDLIEAMRVTGEIPKCAVMVDGREYDIEWPSHWKIHQSDEHLEMQLAINELFALYPNEPTYGLLTDQARPESKGWSSKMESAAGSGFIAVSNNMKHRINQRHGQLRVTCYCMGGDLARALGWVWPSFCVHLYGDDGLEDIGYGLGIIKHLPDVVIRSLQQRDGEVPFDANHRRRWNGKPYLEHDRIGYEQWRKNEYDMLIDKLEKFRCSPSPAS